jgi:uncharacterized protein (UPF0262 family)
MSDQRLVGVFLDERSVVSRSAQVDHERKVAIYDLIEENSFKLAGNFKGPFNLHLSIVDNRFVFDIRDTDDNELSRFTQPLSPLRAIIKDYFMICASYYTAIKTATPLKIEAIDMGRRGLHNEGAEILQERLAKKVKIDSGTARRLFTLICILHIRA